MAAKPTPKREKFPLHWKMLIGFGAGLIFGLLVYATAGTEAGWVQWITSHITQPGGELFLRLIFMLVLPLLFSALVASVGDMADIGAFGRIGWRALGYTVAMSSIALIIGLTLVNVVQPGAGVDQATAQKMLAAGADRAQALLGGAAPEKFDIGSIILSLVPSNVFAAANQGNILAVMFFAVMVGVGLVLTRSENTRSFKRAVEGLFEVTMTLIGLVIQLAPYAVFCFMFNLAALFGWDLVIKLGAYMGVVLLALALHMLLVYTTCLRIAGTSPWRWFRQIQAVMLMAFSTASSNATLPTALRVAENELQLPPKISRFVLTIGASLNHNGSALFEGVTVLFLAQFFGVDLSIGQQLMVMLVCILGGIGTAGVPAGSLPVVAMICGMVGVPPQAIGIVLGVDRLLDMCRTTINVTGDMVLATLVSKREYLGEGEAEPALGESPVRSAG